MRARGWASVVRGRSGGTPYAVPKLGQPFIVERGPSMYRVFLFTSAVVLASSQFGGTQAQDKSAKPRIAAQPEDAVIYLLEAAKAGLDRISIS